MVSEATSVVWFDKKMNMIHQPSRMGIDQEAVPPSQAVATPPGAHPPGAPLVRPSDEASPGGGGKLS